MMTSDIRKNNIGQGYRILGLSRLKFGFYTFGKVAPPFPKVKAHSFYFVFLIIPIRKM